MKAALQEIGAYLGELSRDLAECTAAAMATADGLLALQETQAAMLRKLVEMHDEQREQTERLNRYLRDAAKHESGVRDVDKRLRRLEDERG